MDAREARIYIAIIITVIVLGMIIGYFAWSVIRQQRRNLALQKANALAEISAMERERARIAADLHDDLGPVLSVIKFRVDHQEKEELAVASQQLDEVIARMREVANDMMPSILQRKGLIAAIREFIGHAQQSSRIAIVFELVGEPSIPEAKSVHIFRIVQECIHNCIKHSKASNCEIRLEQVNNHLQLECRDNGVGFDVQKESDGIGMRSLHNRTALMNGSLYIHSVPGKGSNFTFEIPVHGL